MSTPWEEQIVSEAFMTPATEQVSKVYADQKDGGLRLHDVLVDGRPVEVERVPERGRTNRVGVRWVATLPGGQRVDGRYETKKGALSAAFLAALAPGAGKDVS